MGNEEVKLILGAYRPNGTDREDVEMAEALENARHDPELNRWFENELAFDTAITSKLQDVSAPHGLREQILAGQRFTRHRSSAMQNWAPLAIAASIAFAFAAGWWTGTEKGERNTYTNGFTEFRSDMVQTLESGIELDARSSDLMQLIDHTRLKSAPSPQSLSISSSASPMGCKVIEWKGRKVSLFCFKDNQGQIIHLFVNEIEPQGTPTSFSDERIVARVQELPTLKWSTDDHQFLLVGQTPETDLSKYY